MLYAAYASNLDPGRMTHRCPHSPARGTGWLTGWRLTFAGEEHGWDGALPTVVEDRDPQSQVYVALYELDRADEHRLDEYETSVYRKVRERVQTLDGEQLAWFYVLEAYEGGLPSASTIGILAEAARAAGAPDDYVRDLESRPCRSV